MGSSAVRVFYRDKIELLNFATEVSGIYDGGLYGCSGFRRIIQDSSSWREGK